MCAVAVVATTPRAYTMSCTRRHLHARVDAMMACCRVLVQQQDTTVVAMGGLCQDPTRECTEEEMQKEEIQ